MWWWSSESGFVRNFCHDKNKTNSWNQLHSISQQRSKQKGGGWQEKTYAATVQRARFKIKVWSSTDQFWGPIGLTSQGDLTWSSAQELCSGWEPKRICTRRKSLLQSSGGSWLARQRAAGQEMNFRRRRWRRTSSSFSSMLLFFIREMVEIC